MQTHIAEVHVSDLDADLASPFGIATGAQTRAENLLVHIVLKDGTEGFGEAAPFPVVQGEDRETARAALASVDLVGLDVARWRSLSTLAAELPSASARCALETAVLDALCRHHGISLLSFFGAAETRLRIDVTLTTGQAGDAARQWVTQGYDTLKVKVGGVPVEEDRRRLFEIVRAAPTVALILDANGALGSVDEALALLEAAGGRAALFEQPFGRSDLARMAELSHRTPVPVAADESATSPGDVIEIARTRAARVINLKATKSGLVGCLDMAAAARAAGLDLMMGAMVETPLALTAAACLAAGLGGFRFVDLDTHLWLRTQPVEGGFRQHGPCLDLSAIGPGHGVRPRRGPSTRPAASTPDAAPAKGG